jgi:hypothetical protein
MGIPARVDLFVVGDKFYQGSTRKKLEYGWCDFLALGKQFVSFFGDSRVMGTIWYLAQNVPPGLLRSFEEEKRQRMWLGRQGERVARIIIEGANYGTRRSGALVPGSEFRCNREQDAVAAIKRQDLAPEALVISADGGEVSPLLSFLEERYDDQRLILVPPDLPMLDEGKVQISHSHLEAAQLGDDPRISWKDYMESKERGKMVGEWYEHARQELYECVARLVRGVPVEDPAHWRESVIENQWVIENSANHVKDFLKTKGDCHLADDCEGFISQKLVDAVTKELEELAQQTSSPACVSSQSGVKEFLHADFVPEYRRLSTDVQSALSANLDLLKELGPGLGRPHAGFMGNNRHPNMKELRFDAADGVWRVAFAFDPSGRPILLAAGDKSGTSDKSGRNSWFYERLKEKANKRFDAHLARPHTCSADAMQRDISRF